MSCVNDTYQLVRRTVSSLNDPSLGSITLEPNPSLKGTITKKNILDSNLTPKIKISFYLVTGNMIIFNDNGTALNYEYKGCDFFSVVGNDTNDCLNQTELNFVEGGDSKFFFYFSFKFKS